MKRCIAVILAFAFFVAQAQTPATVAYYYHGRKIFFPVSTDRAIVRLSAGETVSTRRHQLAVTLRIADTSIKSLPDPGLAAITFSNISAARFNTLPAQLSTAGFTDFIHPCFTNNAGKAIGYGENVVIKLKDTAHTAAFFKLLQDKHCTVVKKYPFAAGIYVLAAGPVNQFDALAVANRLFETGLFEYAEPDFTLLDGLLAPDPNDPLFAYQWSHKNIGSYLQGNGTPGADMSVQQAWDITTGIGIKVAVLDEGVDLNHPDLKDNLLQGFNCVTGTANPGDGAPMGPARAHGTNCTGIIAAVANNGIGIAGIAPDSRIIPVNLTAANGAFVSESSIAMGFDFAWQQGADVISNSWGGGSPSNVLDDAIQRATTLGRGGKGAVVLFASGNNNTGLSYPASSDMVISVGGVNMCGQRKSPASVSCDGETWGASYGTGLDVVAPCVRIVSTDNSGPGGYNAAVSPGGDYYSRFNGTSAATPAAAAVAALILSANSSLTVSQVRSILENTCDKLPGYNYALVTGQPNGSWNNETGHGRVNAFHAVQTALSGNYCQVAIQAMGATRFCAGGNVLLAVINPASTTSYQWRKDGVPFTTGPSVNVAVEGSYDVVATAANGCISTAASIFVTIPANTPALSAFAGIDTLICAGNTVKLGGLVSANGGIPFLQAKRVFGMDWVSNNFIKFSLDNPLQFDTIGKNMVSAADFAAGSFFSGGDFTPYGYYAITENSNRLMQVDTANGAQRLIGIAPAPAGYTWSGLAWDAQTKNMYAIATAASGSRLCTIDPITALVTVVANVPVGATEWIAIRNNGDMYTMSDNNYLYRVNKYTGAATPLPNPVGADVIYEQDADFDPLDDKLYLTTIINSQTFASDFRLADTATGKTTLIGSLGGFSQIDATAIAGPGYVYNWSPAVGLSDSTVAVPFAKPSATTTYHLRVTDMCGNTAGSQVTVTVSTPAPARITAQLDSICVGESTVLHTAASNNYQYQWFLNGNSISNATDSTYNAVAGGAYTVRIVNGACDSLSQPFMIKTCSLLLNNNLPDTLCAVYFYDDGGAMGNYTDASAYTKTITAATAGSLPRLTITSFNTEAINDVLVVYDGNSTSSPILGTLSGIPTVPIVFTGTSRSITIQFSSNSNINAAGWAGYFTCYQPAVYRSKASGAAEDPNSWEVKNGNGFISATDMPHIYDDSIIVQPGHTITINNSAVLDQIWVEKGGVLQLLAPLLLRNGPGDDLRVDGSLLIKGAGHMDGDGRLILNGSLDNSASSANSVYVQTDITGTSAQVLNIGGNFSGIYISNPVVSFNVVKDLVADSLIINSDAGLLSINGSGLSAISINNRLGLQQGRIGVQNAVLNLMAGCVSDSGHAKSFVEGPVNCNTVSAGLSTLYFPVGANNNFRPVSLLINHLLAGPSRYQAQVFSGAATDRSLPGDIDAVTAKRYITIANLGSQPVGAAGITVAYGQEDAVSDPASLRIVKDDGNGHWINEGGAGTTNSTGSISSTNPFTGFGDFVLANANGGSNGFAMRWLSTTAMLTGRLVKVDWTIANETNINSYQVERSADGIHFTSLETIAASSLPSIEKRYSSSDRLPLKGINYYRVRQTDNAGSVGYSKTVLVTVNDIRDVVVWPNPASSAVNVQIRSSILGLKCYTASGQLMYEAAPGTSQHSIPVQHWAAGIYQLKITSAAGILQTRFIKR